MSESATKIFRLYLCFNITNFSFERRSMQDNLGLHNFSSEIVKEEGKKVLFHQCFTNAAHCRKVVGKEVLILTLTLDLPCISVQSLTIVWPTSTNETQQLIFSLNHRGSLHYVRALPREGILHLWTTERFTSNEFGWFFPSWLSAGPTCWTDAKYTAGPLMVPCQVLPCDCCHIRVPI